MTWGRNDVNLATLNKAAREVFGTEPGTVFAGAGLRWTLALVAVGVGIAAAYYAAAPRAPAVEAATPAPVAPAAPQVVAAVRTEGTAALPWNAALEPAVSEATALATLFRLWGTTATSGGLSEASAAVASEGLRCLESTGGLEELAQMNLRAVLRLSQNGSSDFFAALAAIDGEKALILVEGAAHLVPLPALKAHWDGNFAILSVKGRYDRIDEQKASQLLDHALENGVNYLDTAYPYHGLSNTEGGYSEIFLGEYLYQQDLHRQVHLATKIPTWLLKEPEDMDRSLDQQLKRLQTDQIDFYLLHSLKEKNWFHLEDLGNLEFLDSALADGRIKYTGFSTHDETSFFKELVDSYPWDVCQLQYSYLDEQIQVGKEGLDYEALKGIGTVIMEPLKGGVLANYVPPEVRKLWEGFDRTPAEWAFRYLWNLPQIDVVLSGYQCQ